MSDRKAGSQRQPLPAPAWSVASAALRATMGVIAGAILLGAGVGPAVAAEMAGRGWGPRIAISEDPDQFVFGLHLDLYPIAEGIRFVPNVDAGLGDDLFLVSMNVDLLYALPMPVSGEVLIGGSLGLIHADPTGDSPRAETETDLGAVGLIGYEFEEAPVRAEIRFGFSHLCPDLKVALAYTLPFQD